MEEFKDDNLKNKTDHQDQLESDNESLEISKKNHEQPDEKKEFIEQKSFNHDISMDHLLERDLKEIVKDIEKSEELRAIYAEDIMIPSSDKEAVEKYSMEKMREDGIIITNDFYFENPDLNHEKLNPKKKDKDIEIDVNNMTLANTLDENGNKTHELIGKIKELNDNHEAIKNQEKIEQDMSRADVIDTKFTVIKEQEIEHKYSSGQKTSQILKKEVEILSKQEKHEINDEIETKRQVETKEISKLEVSNEINKKKTINESKEDQIKSSKKKEVSKKPTKKKALIHENIEQKIEIKKIKQEIIEKELGLKEEWEKALVTWIKETPEERVSSKRKEELIEVIKKYRDIRESYKHLHDLYLKAEKEGISEQEKKELEELKIRFDNRDEKEEEMFRELNIFRHFYDNNKERWYDSVINSKKERYSELLGEKLGKLKKDKFNEIQDLQDHNYQELSAEKNNDMYELLKKRYNQETGGRAIYGGKETKGFKMWTEDLIEIQKELRFTPDRGTILIKNLFRIIEDYESEIVEFERSLEQKLGLFITKSGNIGRGNSISARQIAKIFGIPSSTVDGWVDKIRNLEDINLLRSTILKMKANMELFKLPTKVINIRANRPKPGLRLQLFSSSTVGIAFARTFMNYDNFMDKTFDIFVDYIDIPLDKGSNKWLSLLLKRKKAFITNFGKSITKTHKYEQLDKYINFLVSIYLIDEKDLKYPLKKGKKLVDLIEECHKLIFQRLKKIGKIADLRNPLSRYYAKRILKGQIRVNNHELFDIVIHSLVALSKAHRNKFLGERNYLFPLSELCNEVSSSERNPDFFMDKFRKGTPLLRAQGRRLIKFLQENFHDNPEELHDVIYETRKHIVRYSFYWYWNKYDIHFQDLYKPQMKAFFDLTLGLNVFTEKGFLPDVHEKEVTIGEDTYVLEGLYILGHPRHHLELGTAGYLILEQYIVKGEYVYQFKLVPLDQDSHYGKKTSIHSLNGIFYQDAVDLVNARLLHLYELVNRPQEEGVTLDDFRDEELDGIWDKFNDDILNKWIERWSDFKSMSEKKIYNEYYPNFYEKLYIPFMKDFELYKAKNPNCQFPEFWFWYTSNYLGEELLFHNKNNP